VIYGDGKVGAHDGTGLASGANERFFRNQLGVIDPEAVDFFRYPDYFPGAYRYAVQASFAFVFLDDDVVCFTALRYQQFISPSI
jgi:hypothetical protein